MPSHPKSNNAQPGHVVPGLTGSNPNPGKNSEPTNMATDAMIIGQRGIEHLLPVDTDSLVVPGDTACCFGFLPRMGWG